MAASMRPLLLASLLLISQSNASVHSLVDAIDEMQKATSSILDPNAWTSQTEVLARFGNKHPSAAIKSVREDVETKISDLKKSIAEERDRLLLPTDWCLKPWKRVRTDLCISTSYEAANWEQAKGLCQFFNASLVTFRNLEEYRAVVMEGLLLYQCPWVGIRREKDKNVFYGPKENTFVYKLKPDSTKACVIACVFEMMYFDCNIPKNFICLKKRLK